MGGRIIPPIDELLSRSYAKSPDGSDIWRNIFENPTTVQFDHRVLVRDDRYFFPPSPNVLLLTRHHPGHLDIPRNCMAICPDIKTFPKGDAPAYDSSRCCCNVCCREHASFTWHIHPHLSRPGAPRSCTSSWQCCPTDRCDNPLDDASETRHGSQGMAEDVRTKTNGKSFLNVSYFNARYPRRQLDYFT